LLATRLAQGAELPVAAAEVVEVGDWLIEHTPELNIQLAGSTIRCQPGLQFGSRYVVSPLEGQVFDYLPMEMLDRVRNLDTFAGSWPSTNGPETQMDGRRHFGASCASA